MPFVQPKSVIISEADAGEIKVALPTFLERWGVVFLACSGGWVLAVGSVLLIWSLWKEPALPSLAGLGADQVTQTLSVHKEILEQWRDSITHIFDLLVTKTVMPVVTLLLGYLFGKSRSSS